PNEDRSIWVVLNGEIYNYRELGARLEARGHAFRTVSDTETLVHLYEEHGPEMVEHLRGMFAFAVWDQRRRRMLVARDRLGVKPLYYTAAAGRLAFASELKALLALPQVERRLDWAEVDRLFAFLCTSESGSIVEGVRKLQPGHLMIASAESGVEVRRYW